MARLLLLAYGAASCLAFLGTALYARGFPGNVGAPRSVDAPQVEPFARALAIDLALVGLFAVQHSVMARPAFKRRLRRVVPEAAERSTYVLASSLALFLVVSQWRPLGGTVWSVAPAGGRAILHAGGAAGWLLILVTAFAINPFDLLGLRQAWRAFRGQPQTGLPFVTPIPYRVVRHPLYAGWFLAFWSTPDMTGTHLLFAAATTAYILVAIRFEERDLLRAHPEYEEYRQRVPMFMPAWRRHPAPPAARGPASV